MKMNIMSIDIQIEDSGLIFNFNYSNINNFKLFEIILIAIYYDSEDLIVLGIEEMIDDDPMDNIIRSNYINIGINNYEYLYPILKPHIQHLVKNGESVVIDVKSLGISTMIITQKDI